MKTNYLLLSLLAFVIASCSSGSNGEIDPVGPPSTPDTPTVKKIDLSFTTRVLDVTRNCDPELNSTKLEKDMVMSVRAYNITGLEPTDSAINKVIPIMTQYVSDGLGNLIIQSGESPLSYPISSQLMICSFPMRTVSGLATNQTLDKDFMESDYMIGLPTTGNPITVSTDAIGMQYTHAMSKIVLNLKINDFIGVYPNLVSCVLKDVHRQFYDPNFTDIRYMVQTPQITAIGDSCDITICSDTTFVNIEANQNGDRILKMAGIIVPEKFKAGKAFIQVTCGNEIGEKTYNYRLTEDINFEPGKVYTFNLSPRFVDITTSHVTNWADGGRWDGDITSD